MYPECILNVSYEEDKIHWDTHRIHHDTRIHPLTHGPTRAPLGYTRIQQDTTGYIRSCVSPQVADDAKKSDKKRGKDKVEVVKKEKIDEDEPPAKRQRKPARR